MRTIRTCLLKIREYFFCGKKNDIKRWGIDHCRHLCNIQCWLHCFAAGSCDSCSLSAASHSVIQVELFDRAYVVDVVCSCPRTHVGDVLHSFWQPCIVRPRVWATNFCKQTFDCSADMWRIPRGRTRASAIFLRFCIFSGSEGRRRAGGRGRQCDDDAWNRMNDFGKGSCRRSPK